MQRCRRRAPRSPAASRAGRASGWRALALALAALACSGPAAAPRAAGRRAAAIPSAPSEARLRADAAIDALIARFWDGARATFTRTPGGPAADYWVSAQALDSVLDAVERGRQAGAVVVARAFVAAQDARGWRRDFFDDESWMALALLRAADLTSDPLALRRAEALLDDVEAQAPDATCCGDRPGGLWWDRAHTQKATAANAGAVIAAARMFARTGEARHLAFARSVFAYWMDEMVDSTGRVADHVSPSGEKVWWSFTYNEGTTIGAAVALYRATGDPDYLASARKIGAFMRAHQTVATPAGLVLSDGPACTGDCDQFKGIAHRYLGELAEEDPAGGWDQLLRAGADAIWDLDRDAGSDTFGVDWAGPPRPANLATQSSAAMALASAAAPGAMIAAANGVD
jgi:predicted alpha-1,6-mannanase (GH76 family)